MSYQDSYEEWLMYTGKIDGGEEELHKELLAIRGDDAEIKDRFYKDLEFGTGGMRGILGAGTNRMNRLTIRKATQGLAEVVLNRGGKDRGVAIAYDSRHMSPEFALETALCLNANGIVTYSFPSLRPTPQLSFAVRELGCMAGVMITASHNPAEYNGYKVYWEDGAQITPPVDGQIMEQVIAAVDFDRMKSMQPEKAKSLGLYRELGRELDDSYIEAIKRLVLSPEALKQEAGGVKIVYTPLHGTGRVPVLGILTELGFTQVHVVREQELPDGNFPTVVSPNPEDKNAFQMALALAKEVDADLVLGTDPDADRLGVYVKNGTTQEYQALNGNMTGILLCEYILSRRKALGSLPEHGVVVKTIVTTNMVYPVARHYGAEVAEVLTGFKFIGGQIREYEKNGKKEFLFGFEESYGCLTGTYARDKDGVSAAALLCEAAAYYRTLGISLWQQLQKLYECYGFYQEYLETVTKKGEEGCREIRQMMADMRQSPPKEIKGKRVCRIRDYSCSKITDCRTGEVTTISLPQSDVLYYELEEEGWYCARPSGTEPKIKFYGGWRQTRPKADDNAYTVESDRLTICSRTMEEMETIYMDETNAEMKQAYLEMFQLMGQIKGREEMACEWRICLKNGLEIGGVGLKGLPDAEGKVEIGYGIHETYQNKGYATEAVSAMTEWCFNQPDVQCVQAQTDSENRISQKVLLKNGFVQNGEGAEGPLFEKINL